MVSSSVSISAKSPVISYADHAKKAQPKPPNSAPSQRTTVATSTSSNASTTSSTGTLSNPSASKSDSTPTSVDVTPDSSTVITRPHSRPSSPSLSPIENISAKAINGRDTDEGASMSFFSSPSRSIPSKPQPVANIWSVRKEQMAAQAQNQVRAPPRTSAVSLPSHIPSQNNNSSTSPSISRHPRHASDASDMSGYRPSNILQSVNHRLISVLPGDSSSVSSHLAGPSPPSVNDKEVWPEVGRSLVPTATTPHQISPVVEPPGKDEDTNHKGQDTLQSHGSAPRKSERTKWVPIPPEELQAAADALRVKPHSHSRNHSRSQSQHTNSTQQKGGNSRNNHGAASGSGSGQGYSRTHSGRNSIAQSVSHSQAQSRSGSVQSSPKHNNRGRRLAGDEVLGGNGHSVGALAAVSKRSRTSSPQRHVGPSLSGQPIHSARVSTADSDLPGTNPTYYPSIPPVPPPIQHDHGMHQPAYALPPNSSLSRNPYGLPGPNAYGHQGSPVLPPSGYQGTHTPPYSAYAPYGGYEFNQPYMYWNGSLSDPQRQNATHPRQGAGFVPAQVEYRVIPGVALADGDMPPPTMVSRSPPPLESEAVVGNKDVASVLPDYSDVDELSRLPKEVVFGSIGQPESAKSPSPIPQRDENMDVSASDSQEYQNGAEKAFTTFSIGVAPGEPGPSRIRSRTRSTKARTRAESKPTRLMSDVTNAGPHTRTEDKEVDAYIDRNVVDLTNPETKWEFGTTKHIDQVNDTVISPKPSHPPAEISTEPIYIPPQQNSASLTHIRYHPTPPPNEQSVPAFHNGPPVGVPLSAPLPMHGETSSLLSSKGSIGGGDEWEVKDYGFGFGHVSGTPDATTRLKAEMLEREKMREIEREKEKEREREKEEWSREQRDREREQRDREREQRDREREQRDRERGDSDYPIRPRRGSYVGGWNGFDRGVYSGRRGRGGYGGGRGYHPRGFGRGGYQPQHHQRQPPFTVNPPQPLPVLPSPAELATLNIFPPTQPMTHYVSNGYDSYSPVSITTPHIPQITPPLPVPSSVLSFPLDLTRYYLLGQLEYYLSPQNMAQDYYLRQQMDSRGWISIPLIASFNRVRQLTMDVQLVKEVLFLSDLVQIKDSWVRMGGWERFVLPDAPASTVEQWDETLPYSAPRSPGDYSHPEELGVANSEPGVEIEEEVECEVECEEEEEEDVVFVLDRETEGAWTPERQLS